MKRFVCEQMIYDFNQLEHKRQKMECLSRYYLHVFFKSDWKKKTFAGFFQIILHCDLCDCLILAKYLFQRNSVVFVGISEEKIGGQDKHALFSFKLVWASQMTRSQRMFVHKIWLLSMVYWFVKLKSESFRTVLWSNIKIKEVER